MALLVRLLRRQVFDVPSQCRALSKNDFRDKIKYGEDYIQPRSRPRIFLVRQFLQFVEKYETFLKKHAPTAYEVYSSLSVGTKFLYRDIVTYIDVSKELSKGKKASDLTRHQLEIYYQIPKDILRVAPTLVIALLPLTNYALLPMLYAYPKILLSSQFWTEKQRRYFAVEKHLSCVQYHDSILWHLEKGKIEDSDLKEKLGKLLETLKSGEHPTVGEILELKPLFQDGGIFALHNLSYGHLRSLSYGHGITLGGLMPYGKLWQFGGFLWEMDRSLSREKFEDLSDSDLIECAFWRGFNPIGANRAEVEDYLEDWMKLSLSLKDQELSLILHAPIFLAQNHRNNFGLDLL